MDKKNNEENEKKMRSEMLESQHAHAQA